MTFLADNEQKKYFFHIVLILTGATLLAGILWRANGQEMKKAFLEHDGRVVSSLLEQGVSESVIAEAFSEKEALDKAALETEAAGSKKPAAEKGKALLLRMGIGGDTELFFLPRIRDLHRDMGLGLAGLLLFLWGSLLLLCGHFLCRRERLYEKATNFIDRFMKESLSEHLPRTGEGSLYRLFRKIDTLANALSAENEKALEAKNFLKETISDISHQLKTPLSALTMYNEIIQSEIASDTGSGETALAFLEKSAASLARMEELIQTLLKATQLDAGSVLFEKQPWPVPDLAARALSQLLVRAGQEQKQILLTGDENVWVNCDLQWTGEALGNLVKNALDHTDCQGHISVSWEKLPESVRIFVADDGTGIDEKDIYYIFRRFYRASKKNSKSCKNGVGLGLPLAKSIIEGQGGTLSVQSRSGEGTTFTLTLPG